MKIKLCRVNMALIASMTLASCDHQEPQIQHPSVATPTQHWTQGERLKKVMEQIAGLHGAFPKGLPEDAESSAGLEARRTLSEAAAVADALADAAKTIPSAVENKPMSVTDRRGFVAEAGRLRDQAVLLRDAARVNHVEPLQGMLDNINATCIACHSRYRDISGELNTHKASTSRLNPEITASTVNSR